MRAGFEVSVSGADSARRLLEGWSTSRARANGEVLRLHVEVDSGMGRGGVAPADLPAVIASIDAAGSIDIVGVWSHLADGSDPGRSGEQRSAFEAALAAVAATGRAIPARHMAATEGLFCATGPAYEMVRIGLGLLRGPRRRTSSPRRSWRPWPPSCAPR